MDNELERRIRGWRFERFRSQWIEGTVRFVVVAAGFLLAALLLDRFWVLPQSARWVLLWCGVGTLLVSVHYYYLLPLRSLRAPKLLRDVAEFFPEMRAYLSSAWELKNFGASRNTSSDLTAEHLRRTEELLARLPGNPVFPSRPSRPSLKRTVFAAAAWGMAMPFLYNGQADFQRVLAPWRDAQLDALVTVEPGDRDVVWAESVDIRAKWRSPHANGPLVLYVRPEGGSWERVPWEREEGLRVLLRIEGLTRMYEYRVGYKELRTRAYRLTPIPYPHLSDISVRVHLPGRDPTAREMDLEGEGEIAALRRSWVTLRGRSSRPLRYASLVVSYLDSPVVMKKLGGGEWEGGFPLTENGNLKIDLVSKEGARDPRPVAYALRALDDEKPRVQMLSPTFELEISRKEKLIVTYEASDDYGLGSLSLLYRVNGGRASVIPLEVFKARARVQHIGDYEWGLASLPIGSRVEFRIRAVDNARPQANTTVSNKGVLHVVDFESVHAATERMWLGAEQSLHRLADREAEMVRRLAEMMDAQAEAKTSGGRERVRRLSKRLDAEHRALGQEWSETIRDMEGFFRTMRKDPYANPGMTETAGMLSAALKAFKDSDLKAAEAAADAGKFGEAKGRHTALESRVRKVSEILTAGREMQAMQDFWGEAHRMDQAGSEISQELDRIAKSGKAPGGEAVKKLQQALRNLQEQMDALTKTIESFPKADPESSVAKNRKIYRVPLKAARRTADALQAALARGDFETAVRLAKQLARQLSQVREALAQAAQSAAGGGEDSTTAMMERVGKMWDDVVERQSRSLEMVNVLEDGKLAELAKAQKSLLGELTDLQAIVVADAGKRAALVTAALLRSMKTVLEEFKAARVRKAPATLQNIVASLGFRAQRFPRTNGKVSPDGEALLSFSAREKKILDKLKKGAGQPPLTEEQFSGMMAASAVQRQTRRKTEVLERAVSELEEKAGTLPPAVRNSLGPAQAEQKSAEANLSRRDSGGARGHQQKALEHLERGLKALNDALSRQKLIEQEQASPFGQPRGIVRPVGRGGRTGFQRGFVPLPGAEDYQPPREIRREIEKSLRERRPRVFDDTVNDYLKRMSQ